MKNKFLKNCLALFLITLVAGVSLAFVNEITKEPIAKAQDKARLEAYEVVIPMLNLKRLTIQMKYSRRHQLHLRRKICRNAPLTMF